jgi:pimeloyl-ACP methyl ester carboxylesterase
MMNSKRSQCLLILVLLLVPVIFAYNFPFSSLRPVTPAASRSQTPNFTPPAASPTPFQSPPLPSNPTTLSPSPSVTFQPIFEPAACEFPIPAGTTPDCGYLVVPENRSRPGSPLIRLHVAVFRNTAANPASDPVVHLAGGPGGSSLEEAVYLFNQGMDAILERRDFILFDQRGTGHSQPRLDCPEREALEPTLLENRLTPDESDWAILEAFSQCHDRLLAEGNDLSAYNSASSAADVNDLRMALGYEQINLYGVSYGTRLALTILRDYPQAVRSAVLDSVYPLEVNLYTTLAPNAERSFNVLFERCAADPGCSTSYPDLGAVFYNLVDQLNANPVQVRLSVNDAEQMVWLDGGLLIDVLFVGMYNPFVTASMPKMVFDIRQGDYIILEDRLGLYFDTSSALGMQMSVQCAEEIPFNTLEDALTLAQSTQPQITAFYTASVRSLFAACQAWNPAQPEGRENQAVTSDRPTLVLAGEFDPVTPPDWGRQVAISLSQAHFYEFPAIGHWVTRSSNCALQMSLAFWDDPTSAPDASCIQSIGGLEFR